MADFHRLANTELALDLALNIPTPSPMPQNTTNKPSDRPLPSLTLPLSGDSCSSFSNASTLKREREVASGESVLKGVENTSGEDGGGNGNCKKKKKKLRLNKAQSGLLDEAFKLHTTLHPKEKQKLARDLKLRPRQVEVWFQNRRARTKLKQTELDYEYLKKCCKTLTDENQRLRQEVERLRVQAQPNYMAAATRVTLCPSCQQIRDTAATKGRFTTKPYFFNSSSAAC